MDPPAPPRIMRPNLWLSRSAEGWLAAGLLLACWAVCTAGALTQTVNRDEHMYLAAASLAPAHRIYEDFAFLQTPYSVAVYDLVRALSPGSYTLLPARLFKSLLAAALVLVLFRLMTRFGARPLTAALLACLLFQASLVRDMTSLARNYDLAQLSILLALLLQPPRSGEPAPVRKLVLSGVLAGAAIGFKLTYAPLAGIVFAWPLLSAQCGWKRALRWTGAGVALGLLPMLLTAGLTDATAFRFSLLDYHFLNAEFHVQEGHAAQNSLATRAHEAWRICMRTDHWPLTGITLGTLIVALLARMNGTLARNRVPSRGRTVWLAICILAATMLVALVPRPLQSSYLAPALYGSTLLVAALCGWFPHLFRNSVAIVAILVLGFGIVTHIDDGKDLLREIRNPSRWTGIELHRQSQFLAELTRDRAEMPVLTTHPIDALEAGRRIYPELATAEFVWRSGQLLTPTKQARLHVVAASTLESLLEVRPPGAVVTEVEAPWDGPLVEWAQRKGWTGRPVAGSEMVVWVPDLTRQESEPADPSRRRSHR